MSYLFLVSIGPVQEFIATARRTRDLAFGSWLLSELSRAAAQAIVAPEGLEPNGLSSLIFPAPAEAKLLMPDNTQLSVGNKIIAHVRQHPQDLGPVVHTAVKKRLEKLRDLAYQHIPFGKEQRAIAEAQVDDLVELAWVALPFQEGHYEQTRKELEALMAARKNTRDFKQMPEGRSVPKSSLDGQLESVIPETAYPSAHASEGERRDKLRRLYEDYGAGPAERLSGVDLLKRRGVAAYGAHFPSTSHIATLPFLERLKALTHPQLEQVQKAWETYIQVVKNHAFSPRLEQIPDSQQAHPILGRYDGSLLFEDRLVDVLYAPGIEISRDKRFQEARKALSDFYETLDKQAVASGFGGGGARPAPYYALLQADGDGMGELIDVQARHGPDRHRNLSQRLSLFAEQVAGIVRQHRGALVYAGGDDVLAFLPLDTVLRCAGELAGEFRKAMQEFIHQQGNQENGHPTPSLSVGIAIAHHLDLLQRVRNITQEAERSAKRVPGKNALAITLSKRSGEDYRIAGRWGDLDISLQRLVSFARQGAIPTGTAYELRELALRLGLSLHERLSSSQKQSPHGQYVEVIQLDALRIIRRKLQVLQGKFPKQQAEAVERFFKARLGIEQAPHPDRADIHPVSLGELINELIVAQLLAKAQQLAMPQKEESRRWRM